MSESVDDIKQGGCLYKPISGHLSTHGHMIMHLTGLRKKLSKSRPVNFWQWRCGY